MPELPEVETVCRGLKTSLTGTCIKNLQLRRKDLRTPFPANFAQKLAGRRIKNITRRAKYLLFELDNGLVLIAHLGMTGRFSVNPKAPKTYATHDDVIFTLDDNRVVIYNDARRFGVMDIAAANALPSHPLLSHLGPEPLEKTFSPAYLKSALSKRKAPIKPVLMDQELVVGVGNIYASEALFLAGISPLTPAHKVADKAPLLIKCIRKVLQDAITSGGSSMRDFLHVSGEAGYFQHQFNVYGREGEGCTTCKTPITAITQAGRSSFYCATCQE